MTTDIVRKIPVMAAFLTDKGNQRICVQIFKPSIYDSGRENGCCPVQPCGKISVRESALCSRHHWMFSPSEPDANLRVTLPIVNLQYLTSIFTPRAMSIEVPRIHQIQADHKVFGGPPQISIGGPH